MLQWVLAMAMISFLTSLANPANAAFHNGGVGNCDGCHTMHSSEGFLITNPSSRWLIKAADPSSICLNCHAGRGSPDMPHIASPDGSALSPGGDFYWLTKDFTWLNGASPGVRHGHNITAQDYGFTQDTTTTSAPGGTYLAADLSCTSCHDPHGKIKGGTGHGIRPVSGSGSYGGIPSPGTTLGNYRLLGDSVYNGGAHTQGFTFIYDAPKAVQNRLLKFGEKDASHVAYGSGMSEWCANCHVSYLIAEHDKQRGFEHPAGNNEKLPSSVIDNYNAYVRTGDLSGAAATAYLQFVPFERGVTDLSLLDPTSTFGPDSNSNVMCLTCHRAHASAFRAIGRWDFDAALLADSHPAAADIGVAGNDVLYSYYGRDIASEFGLTQKPFCEKCHDVEGP